MLINSLKTLLKSPKKKLNFKNGVFKTLKLLKIFKNKYFLHKIYKLFRLLNP